LVNLHLHGARGPILQFINSIDMSAPLHNVTIRFRYSDSLSVTSLAGAAKEIVAAYYECEGLGQPRELHCLMVSLDEKDYLTFDTQSCYTPAPNPRSHLKLQFDGVNELIGKIGMDSTFPFFPLNDVRDFSIKGLGFSTDGYRRMLQKSTELSHLRVTNLDIGPLLEALDLGYQGMFRKTPGVALGHSHAQDEPFKYLVPKMESLTICHLDILYGRGEELLGVVGGRYHHGLGLERLVVRSCRVHEVGDDAKIREVVKEVKWEDVTVVGWDYTGSSTGEGSGSDSNEPTDLDDY